MKKLKILASGLLVIIMCMFLLLYRAIGDFDDLISSANSIETLSEETIYEVVDKQTDRQKKVTLIVKDVHTNERSSLYIVDTLTGNEYYNTFKYLVVGDQFIYKGDGAYIKIEEE